MRTSGSRVVAAGSDVTHLPVPDDGVERRLPDLHPHTGIPVPGRVCEFTVRIRPRGKRAADRNPGPSPPAVHGPVCPGVPSPPPRRQDPPGTFDDEYALVVLPLPLHCTPVATPLHDPSVNPIQTVARVHSRRSVGAASAEARKSISRCAPVRVPRRRHDAGREGREQLVFGRNGTSVGRAFDRQYLAHLLKADLDLAACDDRRDALALYAPALWLQLFGQAEPGKQLRGDIGPAHARGIADRFGGEQRLPRTPRAC